MALNSSDIIRIKKQISDSLQANTGISPANATSILPVKDLQGKIYEAYILALIIERLVTIEGCSIQLVSSGNLLLKQKGSPINRRYPYFKVSKDGKFIGEIFTDTEFTTISFEKSGNTIPRPGDYHELDIAMFTPGCKDRPSYKSILLAVECKATTIEKATFREMLGFRREMAFLIGMELPTEFEKWPARSVACHPRSLHLCYSTDPAILKYVANGLFFGMHLFLEAMP